MKIWTKKKPLGLWTTQLELFPYSQNKRELTMRNFKEDDIYVLHLNVASAVYIYIYTNLPVNAIVRLPHPRRARARNQANPQL